MKRFLAFFLFLILGMNVHAEEVEEPDELYAQSAVLMDAESGRVLFEKNGFDVKAMASTTKIMTCILALEYGDENTAVTFSDNAAKQPKVHLGASSGEEFYMRDLLYSLMLESHNDSAVAIAETVAGDVASFAKKMNQKAKEIGCENTYFITPNGLDASDENGTHSTTAVDLAKIMSYCVLQSPKKERFLEITATPSHSFANLDGNRSYSCTNRNTFLNMMNEAISGKTGYTADAGYCYVGAVESEGRTFVVSLLACGWPNNKNYKWSDMRKIVNYALENYHYRDVYENIELPKILVENGVPENGGLFDNAYTKLKVEADADEQLRLLLREDERIDRKKDISEALLAPVQQGDVVGSVTYYLNEEVIKKYAVVVAQSVDIRDFMWYFHRIMEGYLI